MKVTKLTSVEVSGLGDLIKEARLKDPRPLTRICSQVGMTPQNWYRIEREEQDLPEETLRKIEAVLGVDFGVIID